MTKKNLQNVKCILNNILTKWPLGGIMIISYGTHMGQVLIFPVPSPGHWINYQLIKNPFLEVLFLWPKIFVPNPGKVGAKDPWVCIIKCIRGFLWWLVKFFVLNNRKLIGCVPSCVWLIEESLKYAGPGPSWNPKHPFYWDLSHTHEQTPAPGVIKRVSGDTGHVGHNQWPETLNFLSFK